MKFINFLNQLRKNHKAVPSFNVFNLETIQAVSLAAIKLKQPVIIQVSEKALAYAGFEVLPALIAKVWQATKLPLYLHLDHGKDLNIIKQCINSGFFTSVHIDASDKPLVDNIKLTKQVVTWAQAKGVAVQGELGTILGKEGYKQLVKEKDIKQDFTPRAQVPEYVSKSGVDYLAVSIGNIHGNTTRSQGLDYDLLKGIYRTTNLPLVLHGGSGIRDQDLLKVKNYGVTVVNIDSDLRIAFAHGFKKVSASAWANDPRTPLSAARIKMSEVAETKIKLLN